MKDSMRKILSLYLAFVTGVLPVNLLAESDDMMMETEAMFFQDFPKVVTASKRAESIQDAPGIVTVITSEQIRSYGAVDLRGVLDRMPSIYTTGSNFHTPNLAATRGDVSTHS